MNRSRLKQAVLKGQIKKSSSAFYNRLQKLPGQHDITNPECD